MSIKFMLCSDWHLLLKNPEGRIDNAFEAQWKKMEYLYWYASMNDITAILQAGDVFDKDRSWYLMDKWLDFFVQVQRDRTPLYTVYGQHDTHLYSEETRGATTLGALLRLRNVHLLHSNEPHEWASEEALVDIYGCSYGEDLPEIEKDSSTTTILVIHKEITPEKMWEGQEAIYAPKFLNTHPEFDLILCGDIHRTFRFTSSDGKRHIVNTGPLFRKEANKYNYDHTPGFFIYDAEKRKLSDFKVIPHEPSKNVLTRVHIEKKEEVNKKLSEFIGAVKEANIELGTDFQTNLQKVMKEAKANKRVRAILAEVMGEE